MRLKSSKFLEEHLYSSFSHNKAFNGHAQKCSLVNFLFNILAKKWKYNIDIT